MQRVYQAVMLTGSHRHMPFPFCFYPANGVLYTNFVMRSNLVRVTMRSLLLRVRPLPGWLVDTYHNVGIWLKTYHTVMARTEKVTLGDLLDQTEGALASAFYFVDTEKRVLIGYLHRMRETPGKEYRMTLTRPHNDFSGRDIIQETTSDFTVVEWDAMIHKSFPQKASIWNGLTCFFTHTQSLARFYPAVSPKQIRVLLDSFQGGYFSNRCLDHVSDPKPFLWIFALPYFIGLIGDRPLHKIYQKRMTSRYVVALRKTLLLGENDTATAFR